MDSRKVRQMPLSDSAGQVPSPLVAAPCSPRRFDDDFSSSCDGSETAASEETVDTCILPLHLIVMHDMTSGAGRMDRSMLRACRLVCREWRDCVDACITSASPSILRPELPELVPALRALDLTNGVTDSALSDVLPHLPLLTSLRISRLTQGVVCPPLTIAAPGLRDLALRGCFALEQEALESLTLTALTRLDLAGCPAVEGRVAAACSSSATLQRLSLWACRNLSGEGLRETLGPLSALQDLNVSYCTRLGDDALAEVARVPGLRSLRIDGLLRVSADALPSLSSLRHLRRLSVQGIPALDVRTLDLMLRNMLLEELSVSLPESSTSCATELLRCVLTTQRDLQNLTIDVPAQDWWPQAGSVGVDDEHVPILDLSPLVKLTELRIEGPGTSCPFIPLAQAIASLPSLRTFHDACSGTPAPASLSWAPLAAATTITDLTVTARRPPTDPAGEDAVAEDIAALHALPGLSCVRFNLQGLDLPALTETADHVKDIGVHHASLAAASISLALSSVQLTSLTLSDLSVKVPTGGSVSEELACVGACRSLRVLRLRRVLSSLLQAAASSEVPDVVRSVDVLEHQVVRSLTGLQELELTACVIGERLLARAGALPLLTHLNMAKSVFVSDSLCGDGSGPEGGPSLSLSGRPVVALAEAHALGSGYLRHINLNQCRGLCVESVCSLASLPGLTTLDASGTGLEEHASAISRKFGDSVRVLVKGARESWNQA